MIDAESLEMIKQIDVGQGPHGVRTSIDGSKIFVGITTTNEIQVIDTITFEIKDTIQSGSTPFWLAVSGNP